MDERAVRPRRVLQVLEVADRADVVEPVVLEERDAGRVVAAVLEPLEALEQERLALPAADVSDDSAHLKPPFPTLARAERPENAKSPATLPQAGSAELPLYEGSDPSTELLRLLLRLGLAEHPDHRLRAGRAHEHAAAAGQLGVEPLDLRESGRRAPRGGRRARSPSPAGTAASRPPPRRASGLERRAEQQRRGETVAGDVVAKADDVAGLLAAEHAVLAAQRLEHVAVADVGRDDADALAPPSGGGSRDSSSR